MSPPAQAATGPAKASSLSTYSGEDDELKAMVGTFLHTLLVPICIDLIKVVNLQDFLGEIIGLNRFQAALCD